MAGEIVIVKTLGGVWEQIGTAQAAGVVPEALTCTSNEWGSDTASFMLKRDPSQQWPDLMPFNQIEVWRHGRKGWAGRIDRVDGDHDEGTLHVQCKGRQYELDDDLIRRFYVQRKLTDWKDWRSNLAADLAVYKTDGTVEVGEGAIVLRPGSAGATTIAAYLDLGPGAQAKRVVLDWETSGFGTTGGIYLQVTNTIAGAWTNVGLIRDPNAGAGSGTYRATVAGHRYIIILANPSSAGAADKYFRVTQAKIFAETSYESGDDSVFTLDMLVKDVRDAGTDLISGSDTEIETFSFGIPELAPKERKTPRELIGLGHAFHDCKLQVDVEGRIVAKLKATAPRYAVGAWTQQAFKDGTISGESLVSGVVAEGQSSTNEPIEVERDATDVGAGFTTLPERQGFDKRVSVPVQSTMTTALGERLADTYLANHIYAPFKGEQIVQGWGDVREILTGAPAHAFDMLTETEELLGFENRIDPDTGGIRRDGRMKSVSYNADTEESTVAIDNESRKFEALAARVAGLAG
mgnify:CR=1 FL=1